MEKTDSEFYKTVSKWGRGFYLVVGRNDSLDFFKEVENFFLGDICACYKDEKLSDTIYRRSCPIKRHSEAGEDAIPSIP